MDQANEQDLSPDAVHALIMARDQRPYPGDFQLRVAVLARPSPGDVVRLLDKAAYVGTTGCMGQSGARLALQQMARQSWSLDAPGGAKGGCFEIHLPLASGLRTVTVRRLPEPVIVAVR